MKNIIITGCDSAYFSLAQGLVQSLRQHPGLAHHGLGFLDFGLDESQRRWLAERQIEIKPGGWDMDFPSRAEWEATRPWFKVYLCRPHLRQHFPGYDVYLWLDADTWVQQPQAIDHLVAAAAQGGMAVVPEIDRSYRKYTQGHAEFATGQSVWQLELHIANYCLGPELGRRLALAPNFNAGVFAMRNDAPQWDKWRYYLDQALGRVDPMHEESRMAEQASLNAALYLHDFPTHRFPSTYNWLACLSLPSWDIDAEKLVEPSPPHAPIHIMHLSLHVLAQTASIRALDHGEPRLTVKTPLTFEGGQALKQAQPQLLAALQSGRKQPPKSRPDTPNETDYVSPGLTRVGPDAAFPHMVVGDKNTCGWQYLRRQVPHRWYVDGRLPVIGFLNRDEAHILYNTALQFEGRRALEVGCWMGWSACHLALAGVTLDVVDPTLRESQIHASVSDSLRSAGVLANVNLLAGASPQAVRELADRENRKWALIFIDGDHEGEAPRNDAVECEQHAEADAAILFHDLASPHVAAGLRYLHERGWQTRVYQTMQIMGIAWRGNVTPVDHIPDPAVPWAVPPHLREFSFGDQKPKN